MEGETEATPELQEATCRCHPGSSVWCHWWGKGVGTPFSNGDTRGVYLLLTLCQLLLLLLQLLLPFTSQNPAGTPARGFLTPVSGEKTQVKKCK